MRLLSRFQFHPSRGTGGMEGWLKLLIAFDIVGSAIMIQTAVLGLCLIAAYKSHLIVVDFEFSEKTLNIQIATVTVFLIFVTMDLLLDVWLWLLVSEKDAFTCQIWLLVKLVLETGDVIGFVVEVCCGHHTALYIIGMSFDTIFTAYILWIVYAFITKLRAEVYQNTSGNRYEHGKIVLFLAERDSINFV